MSKIEGVPEGWELVRLGPAKRGEWVVGSKLEPKVIDWTADPSTMYVIIRRIEPVCTWQHGVLADGYVSQDKDGRVWWWMEEPHTKDSEWLGVGNKFLCPLVETAVVFRSDLPWDQRIQQVGPTIEATLKEAT